MFYVFHRVTKRECNVDSLLNCAQSQIHSGLSVVRDPTTGMLLDFTEVSHIGPLFSLLLFWVFRKHNFILCNCFTHFCRKKKTVNCLSLGCGLSIRSKRISIYPFCLKFTFRFYWRTPACQQKTHCHYNANLDLPQRALEEATLTTPSCLVRFLC